MIELDDIRKRTEGHTAGQLELVSFNLETDDHIDIAAHPVKYEGGRIIAKWIASVENGTGELTEEDHANALLFAAAPDLLRIATDLEAELTQLRTERDFAIMLATDLVGEMPHTCPTDIAPNECVACAYEKDIAALTQREGGEDDR